MRKMLGLLPLMLVSLTLIGCDALSYTPAPPDPAVSAPVTVDTGNTVDTRNSEGLLEVVYETPQQNGSQGTSQNENSENSPSEESNNYYNGEAGSGDPLSDLDSPEKSPLAELDTPEKSVRPAEPVFPPGSIALFIASWCGLEKI